MTLSSIPRARLGVALLTILFGLMAIAALVNPRSSSASGKSANADDPSGLSPQALSLFVNNVGDGPDVNIGDGICDAGGGNCTLRAALQEANSVAGDDAITLAPFPPPSNIILNSALPAIDGNVTISASGVTKINIFRNPAAGTPDFIIFTINSGKTVSISGVSILNGRASGATPNGGGIWNSGALTLSGCRVGGNQASAQGGGIYNAGIAGSGLPATLTINDSDISNNGADGGGGIANNAVDANSTVTINNSTISHNASVTFGGAGIRNGAGSFTSLATLTINNSSIYGNTNTATGAGSGGAGIYNAAVFGNATATVTLNNSTISGNRDDAAGSGGGIFHISSGSGSTANLTINNGTITDNQVTNSGNGGGIHSQNGSSVTNLLLRDTIVAGNGQGPSATANDISGLPVDPTSSYNLIGNGGSGGLVNGVNSNQVGVANPLLSPLGDNGGPTLTHALLGWSPAIDAGNSALTTDQRGQVRPQENLLVPNAAGGNGSDIGAFETTALYEVNSALDADDGACTAVGTGNGCTLREAITKANADAGPAVILFAAALTTPGPAVITLLSALPGLASETTLSGSGASIVVQRSSAAGTPHFRIFTITAGATVNISGLTISKGSGNAGPEGGGVLNHGVLTLTNCTISGNSVNIGATGGGIFNDGTLTLINSTVTGNSAAQGGGLANHGTLTLTNSTVSGNSGPVGGGGIFNDSTAPVTIVNSTVSGNTASMGSTPSLGNGGGIYNVSGTLTLTNTTVSNNSASMNGGGIFRLGGTVNLKNTIVAGNSADGGAGSDLNGTFNSQDYNLIGNTSSASFTGITTHNVTNVNARLAPLASNGGPTQTHALLPNSPALDAGDNSVTGPPLNLSTDQQGFARQVDGSDLGSTATVDIGAFEAQVSVDDFGSQSIFEDGSVNTGVFLGGTSITSVTATSSNTTLIPNDAAHIAVTGTGSLRNLTIHPAANEFGTTTITVTVNGANAQSMTDTFGLTVDSVNDPPSFTKGADQTANSNAGAQTVNNWATNIAGGPSNEAGQPVQFLISNNNNSLFSVQPAISSTGTLTYTPALNAGGTAEVTTRAQDSAGTLNGGQNTSAAQTFNITIVPVGGALRFVSSNFVVGESAALATITVERTGDTSRAVTVDYATGSGGVSNELPCSVPTGLASPKCDFTSAFGTLRFAAGDSSETFNILLNQDSYVDGTESVSITLTNPTNGSAIGNQSTATLTIEDDPVEPMSNPIDDAQNFVRQHYHDFLNREPDAGGLAFWTNQITSCGADQQCIELKRINVSAAFFLSIEFQETGYLVERIYKAAYGEAPATSTFGGSHQISVPIVRLDEFLRDSQQISQGVVVGQPGAELVLENNKREFVDNFVLRPRFTPQAFPLSLTPSQFVDKLNLNAGNPLSQSERDQLVSELTSGAKSRAQVLRAVAEDSDLNHEEINRAFVLMQYFGYLRRNPNDPQDTDYSGYEFWLIKLNQFNGNFINAEMVKAFITSGEYRGRFGQ